MTAKETVVFGMVLIIAMTLGTGKLETDRGQLNKYSAEPSTNRRNYA